MIKKICILSSYYPSLNDPHYAFVGTLVEQFADMGIECHVISPVSNLEKKHRGINRVEETKNGAKISVYCPAYTVFPNRSVLGFRTYRLTVMSKRHAIKRVFKKNIKNCDAIYSHFIESGINAAWLSKITGIPAFVAVGESSITSKELDYTLFKKDLHQHIRGIVSVSTELKDLIYQNDIFSTETPLRVFPNGVDSDIFYPRDKQLCRNNLGVSQDEFVVSFVGAFIERKGIDVLQQIIAKHQEWKCILIGAGTCPINLNKDQIIFCGRLPHDKIPEYICASDVFVLPTHAEGCCNAIVEAMGCGLPVISSDRNFNYDILSDSNSILVDPDNADEIEEALFKLYEDPRLRAEMSKNSEKVGRNLSIVNRARNIVEFMEISK